MKNIKGFTLIELVVTLGLAGIVLSFVMWFFILNYKSYETINTESEVQYQSQYIINYINNVIIEAEKYEGLGLFEFLNGEKAKFEVKDKKIKHTSYKLDGSVKSVNYIGNYVNSIDIVSGGSNGVTISIILDNGSGNLYSVEQMVFMRNSNN